jgi:hypothetical protein
MSHPTLKDIERYAIKDSVDGEPVSKRLWLALRLANTGCPHDGLNPTPSVSPPERPKTISCIISIKSHEKIEKQCRCRDETKLDMVPLLQRSKNNPRLPTSTLEISSVNTSEILAPVITSVKQNAAISGSSWSAALTRAALSAGTMYFRAPWGSKRDSVMRLFPLRQNRIARTTD